MLWLPRNDTKKWKFLIIMFYLCIALKGIKYVSVNHVHVNTALSLRLHALVCQRAPSRIVVNLNIVESYIKQENLSPYVASRKWTLKWLGWFIPLAEENKDPFVMPWWRHQIETLFALLAFCVGNSPVTGKFPSQRPVTRSFDVFFDLRQNKWLSKQSRRRWFETPSRSLWPHCNA